MTKNAVHQLLAEHLPKESLFYCISLWEKHQFHFRVSNDRKTKLGDYRYDRRTRSHHISVNKGLNAYAFLITYLHEVAHLIVKVTYKRRIQPHGNEWKQCFKSIIDPLLSRHIFPEQVLGPLRNHMHNPKASSYSDAKLTRVLREYDDFSNNLFLLSELQKGSIFKINQRTFKKGNTRRTRVLCKELPSGKEFLISKVAEVARLD